jgi:hypothetical protein
MPKMLDIIWRVENDYGEGPYASTSQRWRTRWHGPPKHPGLHDEQHTTYVEDVWVYKEMLFGFRTLNQLYSWFDSQLEMANLQVEGFKVSCRLGQVIAESSKQLVFIPYEDIDEETERDIHETALRPRSNS